MVPHNVVEHTYQNRLRLIGRIVDEESYSSVTVLEVEGGLVVRAFPKAARVPVALELADADFERLANDAFGRRGGHVDAMRRHPLLPTGYEDFFRALGWELDHRPAYGIVVHELAPSMLVTYFEHAQSAEGYVPLLRHVSLASLEIRALVDQAFGRRQSR